MSARLRERHLSYRPRVIAGPGCFVVERAVPGEWRSQVKLTDSLSEAFDIAHEWLKGAK